MLQECRNKPTKLQFQSILTQKILKLSKCYESTDSRFKSYKSSYHTKPTCQISLFGEEEFRKRCDMGQSFPNAPDLVIFGILLKLLQKPKQCCWSSRLLKAKGSQGLPTHIVRILFLIFWVSVDTYVFPRDYRCVNTCSVYKWELRNTELMSRRM